MTGSSASIPPLIHGYADGGFIVAQDFHQGSILIIGKDGDGFDTRPWGITNADDITLASLDLIYNGAHRPALILIGVGWVMEHPFDRLRADLAAEAIKVEIQTTPSACRTWNLLLSEGRKVAFAAIAGL
jgi:uncharacterized protein